MMRQQRPHTRSPHAHGRPPLSLPQLHHLYEADMCASPVSLAEASSPAGAPSSRTHCTEVPLPTLSRFNPSPPHPHSHSSPSPPLHPPSPSCYEQQQQQCLQHEQLPHERALFASEPSVFATGPANAGPPPSSFAAAASVGHPPLMDGDGASSSAAAVAAAAGARARRAVMRSRSAVTLVSPGGSIGMGGASLPGGSDNKAGGHPIELTKSTSAEAGMLSGSALQSVLQPYAQSSDGARGEDSARGEDGACGDDSAPRDTGSPSHDPAVLRDTSGLAALRHVLQLSQAHLSLHSKQHSGHSCSSHSAHGHQEAPARSRLQPTPPASPLPGGQQGGVAARRSSSFPKQVCQGCVRFPSVSSSF